MAWSVTVGDIGGSTAIIHVTFIIESYISDKYVFEEVEMRGKLFWGLRDIIEYISNENPI